MDASDPFSLTSVLQQRRRYFGIRLLAAWCLLLTCAPLLGWSRVLFLAGCSGVIQLGEAWLHRHARRQPWANPAILAIMSVNMLVLCAPAPLLAASDSSWGVICATLLIGVTAAVGTLASIGNRAALLAHLVPCTLALLTLPFAIATLHAPAKPLVVAGALAGAVYFGLSLLLLWQNGTAARKAEYAAVQRDRAGRLAHETLMLDVTRHDSLTGLWNRDSLLVRLGETVRAGQPAALLMLDLDGFKFINDSLGYPAGDQVLCRFAELLRAGGGRQDFAARTGGDEFALLLPGRSEAQALLAAQALLTSLAGPMQLQDQEINVSASAGIALFPAHGTTAEALFAHADLALYEAKAGHGACARLFHPALPALAQAKLRRDSDLRRGFDAGEFEVLYQPQVSLADGRLMGAEALLRWNHPRRGVLPPSTFMAALESSPFSNDVGDWVVRSACAQAAVWRASLVPHFRVGVNLFAAQCRAGDLVERTLLALAEARLPPAALELEITETILLREEDEMIAPLARLRAAGVGIAFDDYGTGFASLAMLTRYPVTRLKIDRGFTQALGTSGAEAAIVRAIIGMAQGLNMEVIAEGVETPRQADMLRRMGAAQAQGYLFGKPLSGAEFWRIYNRRADPCLPPPPQTTLPAPCQLTHTIQA